MLSDESTGQLIKFDNTNGLVLSKENFSLIIWSSWEWDDLEVTKIDGKPHLYITSHDLDGWIDQILKAAQSMPT